MTTLPATLPTVAAPTPVVDPMRLARIQRTIDDPFQFGPVYLPKHFEYAAPAFHREIMDIILKKHPQEWVYTDQDGNTKEKVGVAIAASRNHAKSTLLSLLYPIWAICTQRKKFIIILSATATLASTLTVHIKKALEDEENQKLRSDWGLVLGGEFELYGRTRGKWTDDELELGLIDTVPGSPTYGKIVDTAKIMARSAGSRLRGLRYGARRPDALVVDDLENDEHVETPEQRSKLWNWFAKAVVPMLDPQRGILIIVGTILHHASLLNRILKEQADLYVTRRYAAIVKGKDGKSVPLWPERFSLVHLAQIRRQVGSMAFASEYLNDPRDDEVQVFRPSWFSWYTTTDLAYDRRARRWFFRGQKLRFYVGVDPAISDKDEADEFALVMVGVTRARDFIVFDVFHDRIGAAEQINRILQQAQAFPRVARYEIEATMYQQALCQLLMRRAKLPIHEVKHLPRTNKRKRVRSLAPIFEMRSVYLRACDDDELEIDPLTKEPDELRGFYRDDLDHVTVHPVHYALYRSLVDYPLAEHDDLVDALQFAVQGALKGNRLFEGFGSAA